MRSRGGATPITTRLASGTKPSRCGTSVSRAAGEPGPDHQVRLPVVPALRVTGAVGVAGIVRVRRSLRYLGGPRGVVTRGKDLSHAASVPRGW